MGRYAVFFTLAVLLASCEQMTDGRTENVASDECGASNAQELIGRTVEDLAAVSFMADVTRFIEPGDVVTQDYRPERMNIEFAEDGKISRVYCG